MRKTKITWFYYRSYNDVFVSNLYFSTEVLLSALDMFPEQKAVILIEADTNYIQILSSIGKSVGITAAMSQSRIPKFVAVCSKAKLHCFHSRIHIDDCEGIFMASINNDIELDELVCSVEYTASCMVKNGISDISFSMNIPENQLIISFSKEKYDAAFMRGRVCSIFRG